MIPKLFQYEVVPDWPALAWLGRCRFGSDVVEVFHGPCVETTEKWFGEAIWAGDFEQGAFDQTDIIAGSGGRARDRGIVFVTSGSTVDRLHSFVTSDGILVSNSLCCLLAMTGGFLDPSYPSFHQDFSSINQGLSRYKRQLETSVGPVMVTYFDNLVLTGKGIHQEHKPITAPEFKSFEEYRGFLSSNMQLFVNNAMAATRQQKFRPLCALSNGYDSPTVAVIARYYGDCREAISIDVDRDGKDDCGETIAKYLGMHCTVVERGGWRSLDQPEIPFIAGTPGGSDVLWAAAESKLAATVFFTGYYGGEIWDRNSKDRISDLARSDGSGRSLTEYRLGANFIHCPMPFWGVRRGRELQAISQSNGMQAWNVLGSYSRPICRRIIEEAGIPREIFANRKKGGSVQLYHPDSFLTPKAYQDYLLWLRENRMSWIRKFRFPPIPFIANVLDAVFAMLIKTLSWIESWLPAKYGLNVIRSLFKRSASKIRAIQKGVAAPFYLRRYTYPWAVERRKTHYPVPEKLKMKVR